MWKIERRQIGPVNFEPLGRDKMRQRLVQLAEAVGVFLNAALELKRG
jgi:hypothetical protein